MADIDSALPIRTKEDIDERLQSKIVDFTTPSQGMEVDTDNDAHVKAKLRDDAGAAFGTLANPVAVTQTTAIPGDGIVDFDAASAVAKDATSDHSYAITATKSGRGLRIHMAASGYAKFEISYGTTASEVLKYVVFNSTSQPYQFLDIEAEVELADTESIKITKTNLDNQAQDLYSTIELTEF